MRLTLYTRGVQPPPRGSVQDAVLQRFMYQEMEAEVLKTRILSMASYVPDQTEWNNKINDTFRAYLEGTFGKQTSERDEALQEYYTNVVKMADVRLRKTEEGSLEVLGVETLL